MYLGAFIDSKMKKLDFRTIETMNTFLKGNYSEENVTKIKQFYFSGCDLESKKTRVENIVHVSTFYLFINLYNNGLKKLRDQNVYLIKISYF